MSTTSEPDGTGQGEPSGAMLAARAARIIVRDVLAEIPGLGTALQIVLDEVDLLRPARARRLAVEVAERVGDDLKANVEGRPERETLLFRGLVLSLEARTAETCRTPGNRPTSGHVMGPPAVTG